MILPKIAVPFGFSQILCSLITWNKHKESLFVNSEQIIWTRTFQILKLVRICEQLILILNPSKWVVLSVKKCPFRKKFHEAIIELTLV